jgi:hypothetical protein
MEWNRPPLGQEPKAKTSISDECGEERCQSCSGIYERDDCPGELIFCIHSCHEVRNQGSAESGEAEICPELPPKVQVIP